MARPPFQDPKNVRTVRRMTRLTEDEENKLVTLARRNGMTPSSYMQYMIQKAKIK